MKIYFTAVIPFFCAVLVAHAAPPGVVVAHSPASTRSYLGSPSLVKLENGDLIASHDFFGPGSTSDIIRIYRSYDSGSNWKQSAEIKGGFWSSLFTHRGSLYLIGVNKQDGHVVIRRSSDSGTTWTHPLDAKTGLLLLDAKYHCAPTPVIEHNGRLWRAFEDVMGPGKWGSNFRSFMMSIPVDADLLNAKNWTKSKVLGRDPAWLDGKFGGWLEGNAVVTPDKNVVNILRVDYRDVPEKAAIIEITDNGKTASFDPDTGFIDFPGGCKKFTIRPDPQSGGYWSLSNYIPLSQEGWNVERTRNTLALIYSKDLRDWEVRCILLHHPDREKHAFQYPDWQFDGDDLIALVRTAFDDDTGGAHSGHDANYITFHRWKSFRNLNASASVPVASTP